MKNVMKSLVLLSFVLFWTACSNSPPQKTDLYIYLDYTEGQNYTTVQDDLDTYLTLMEVTEEQPANYGTVKVFPLYDIGSSQSATVKLKEGKSKLEGNRFLRQKEVDKFKSKLTDKVTAMNTQYSGKELDKSYILQPLCKGFSKLEKSDADRKIILIYSDMIENSTVANFHKGLNQEKLVETFTKNCSTEDLSDFEIYIVHPINKGQDQKIQKSAEVWKTFFIKKGLDEDLFHFDTGIDV